MSGVPTIQLIWAQLLGTVALEASSQRM